MNATPPSSNLSQMSRTEELLTSILEELKHLRKHLQPPSIQTESTPTAPEGSYENREGAKEEGLFSPPSIKPEISSNVPEVSYEVRKRIEHLAAYQEFERLMIALDAQLEDCANATRFLGSSAAFISSTYDLRDSLAQLFSCLNLNAVIVYPEIKRAQRFPVTRFNVQHTNHDIRGRVDRKPISGYPFERIYDACKSATEDLEKCAAGISSMTELANVSLIESFNALQYQLNPLGLLSNDPSPDMEGRENALRITKYWTALLNDLVDALKMFEQKTIPAIKHLQKDESDTLQNQSTVATFLSAVTATTIQYTYSTPNPSRLNISVNLLWLVSLTLSLGSAVTSQFAIRWKAAIYHNPNSGPSKWISQWIARIPVAFLIASMLAFIAGLTSFAFLIFPRSVIPPVVTCFSGSCSVILVVIGTWLGFEKTLQELPARFTGYLSRLISSFYSKSRKLFDRAHPRPRSTDVENNAQPADGIVQEKAGNLLNPMFSPPSDPEIVVDEAVRVNETPIGGHFVVDEQLDGLTSDSFIEAYGLSPDGLYAAALSVKRDEIAFRLWTLEKTPKVAREVWGLPYDIDTFSWAPDSRSAVLLGNDGAVIGFVIIKNSATEEEMVFKRVFDHNVNFMSWTSAGDSILTVGREDGTSVIKFLSTNDLTTSSQRLDLLMDGTTNLHGVWQTQDSERFVAVLGAKSWDYEVHVLNLKTATSEHSITVPNSTGLSGRNHIFSRRGLLVLVSWKTLFRVRVDMRNEVKLDITRFPFSDIGSPHFFGENDEYLAVAQDVHEFSTDKKVLVWNVDTLELLFSIPSPITGSLNDWSLRNSPEPRRLLCMWNDGGMLLFGRLDIDDNLPNDQLVIASRSVRQEEGTEPGADADAELNIQRS